MKILFLNNQGAGFADYVQAEPGTTIAQFLATHLPHTPAEDLLVRVNRQPVAADYQMQDGDRVTATPVKIDGAQVHLSPLAA